MPPIRIVMSVRFINAPVTDGAGVRRIFLHLLHGQSSIVLKHLNNALRGGYIGIKRGEDLIMLSFRLHRFSFGFWKSLSLSAHWSMIMPFVGLGLRGIFAKSASNFLIVFGFT